MNPIYSLSCPWLSLLLVLVVEGYSITAARGLILKILFVIGESTKKPFYCLFWECEIKKQPKNSILIKIMFFRLNVY